MLHIESWLEPQGWRPIPMDMPLVRQEVCPCCQSRLEPVVEMSGTVGPTIEVGACASCGYMGYIDRPTEQWFNEFYASDWDAKGKPAYADIQPGQKIEGPLHPAVGMIQRVNVPKDASVLEFGAGFGWAAACVQRHLGYPNVTAVEPCQHRAKVLREVFCLNVVNEIQPANLIYSWHVLEHCYDPAKVIAQCAAAQQPGDTLCLSVPNQVGEPTMGVLLFLPHLHSFTMLGLTDLLARHGYAVTDRVLSTCENLVVIARKLPVPIERVTKWRDCKRASIEKLSNGLGSDVLRPWPSYPIIYWQKFGDIPSVCVEEEWPTVSKGLHSPRAIRVVGWGVPFYSVRQRFPLRFTGHVQLCVK